jgi:hypothetical protein
MSDLIERLRKRAEIRRSIPGRKSVEEGTPDRIAELLEEAASALENTPGTVGNHWVSRTLHEMELRQAEQRGRQQGIKESKDRIGSMIDRRKARSWGNPLAEQIHQEGLSQAWGLVSELENGIC